MFMNIPDLRIFISTPYEPYTKQTPTCIYRCRLELVRQMWRGWQVRYQDQIHYVIDQTTTTVQSTLQTVLMTIACCWQSQFSEGIG